jgi:hypothetical protein
VTVRDDQNVTAIGGCPVEESERPLVLIHTVSLFFTDGDVAEETI